MANQICLLCNKEILPGSEFVIEKTKIESLIKASIRRKDKLYYKMRNKNSLTVHKHCRSQYTREIYIEAALKNASTSNTASPEGAVNDFDFENLCFFCEEDASDFFIKKQEKTRQEFKKHVSFVSQDNFHNSLLQMLQCRKDDNNLKMLSRINSVPNLKAVGARYHQKCLNQFHNYTNDKTVGRPSDPTILAALDFVIDYMIKNRDECQFSLSEIMKKFEGQVPSDLRYLTKKLKEEFGNDIVIYPVVNNDYIFCFKDTIGSVLSDCWYDKKCKNESDERKRIVEAAAEIICQDIRSKYYDTEYYKAPSYFLENVDDDIPETLHYFLKTLIQKNKQGNCFKWNQRILILAHIIISSVRPRSYISSLLLGLSSMMHKKHASKNLINCLSYLGLCSTYDEALLFEASILHDPQQYELQQSYVQFVFDNADHNTNTIDGSNTFHAMGGIMCVTPASSVSSTSTVKRLRKLPPADSVGKFGFINVQHFNKSERGLKQIIIKDLSKEFINFETPEIRSADFLWLYAKKINSVDFPGWNGFMQNLANEQPFSKSRVVPLPFVNASPSDYDTIYTVLLEADRKCKEFGQTHCFVTFDQPLYVKAREILACRNVDDDKLSSVIVRLGGFHTIISFLGSIGFIMDGSGLKEVFTEIYADSSVDKILTGHAYSRAVRGHILTHCALAQNIFSSLTLTEDETRFLNTLLNKVGDLAIFDDIHSSIFQGIKKKFLDQLTALQNNGPTAKLWTQYFNMVTIVKQFIEAERSGNWMLHLQSLRDMLPYFHASGHFLYAKCAHLYLQDMLDLETKMDIFEYEKFTKLGFFTIRRTDKFWSGIWSDMTIEQVLMRSMKTSGGLTQGRGITQSVLSKWILSMIVLTDVTNIMEEFCNATFCTTEQHSDSRVSRIARDNSDLNKLVSFFSAHDPFINLDSIMSIVSGLVGDESINCYNALEAGTNSLNNIIGTNFDEVKFSRKKRVLSLKAVNSSMKINNQLAAIDPMLLFQRICLRINTREDMKIYLAYELAPFPVSLFDEVGMRKTQKSQFYDHFEVLPVKPSFEKVTYVIDGGFLLHRVSWRQNEVIENILNQYVQYVLCNYSKDSTIIFDGYPEDNENSSTKNCERLRRSTKILSKDIMFNRKSNICLPQEKFLCNNGNKRRLITMLCDSLNAAGFSTKQAHEDADLLIVKEALEISNRKDCVIVGEDIDILVLLTQLAAGKKNIYFMKPSKGKLQERVYSSSSFKYSELSPYICFLHVFTGCDTTSAFYRIGKSKLISILNKHKDLLNYIKPFYENRTENQVIADNGSKIILHLYGAKDSNVSLNEFRYTLFQRVNTKKKFKLESLPPTDEAALEHSYRTYYQIQKYMCNELDVTQWGWMKTKTGLKPTLSKNPLIPPDLIDIVTCKCEKGCKAMNCGCRKHGLPCSDLCFNCHGQFCTNAKKIEPEIIDETEEVELNFEDSVEEIDEGLLDCSIEHSEVQNKKRKVDDL